MMKIAIPRFGQELAPCFEAATHFTIYLAQEQEVISSNVFVCHTDSPMERVRLLRQEKIDCLICSGISSFYKDIIKSEGRMVLDHVSGRVNEAIHSFLAGTLSVKERETDLAPPKRTINPVDLAAWTAKLFRENGYEIKIGSAETFPMDIVAEIICPLCGKSVKAAVCCGGHTYMMENEIREFYNAAGTNYDSKIYVHAAFPELEKLCEKYNIELLDPAEFKEHHYNKEYALKYIPILKKPVKGHEKAFRRTSENDK